MSREDLELGIAVHQGVEYLNGEIRNVADRIAAAHNLANAEALKLVTAPIVALYGDPKVPTGELDARTATWRCRFRIYHIDKMDEPVADSEGDAPADRPGEIVLPGLPAVAREARGMAQLYHQEAALLGMSTEELNRRLRALRPTLSRRGGEAVWRIPYETKATFDDSGRFSWLMRVDIQREQRVRAWENQ